jgi:hypothetical protein
MGRFLWWRSSKPFEFGLKNGVNLPSEPVAAPIPEIARF